VVPSEQQTAAILRKRAVKARAEQFARSNEAREIVEQTVRELVKPPAEVWLIGSLAWGGVGERSDVDLVISGVDPRVALQVEVHIARTLDAEVDLLNLEHLPTSFKDRVLAEGVKLV
jgi:predicted nucleotidyltransferase